MRGPTPRVAVAQPAAQPCRRTRKHVHTSRHILHDKILRHQQDRRFKQLAQYSCCRAVMLYEFMAIMIPCCAERILSVSVFSQYGIEDVCRLTHRSA
jgi:hypothetical protein